MKPKSKPRDIYDGPNSSLDNVKPRTAKTATKELAEVGHKTRSKSKLKVEYSELRRSARLKEKEKVL